MCSYKLIKSNDLYHLIDKSLLFEYFEAKTLLSNYYQKGLEAEIIDPILAQLKDDFYFFLLKEIYHNNFVLDRIAENNTMDVSTIKRNKKRLTLIIYRLYMEAKRE